MAKILLVEDDQKLAGVIDDWLRAQHHILDIAFDGAAGDDYLQASTYDLIILDWELPHISGLELCQRYRSAGGMAPILFLTGRGKVPDKVAGFESGADDYVTKPFHLKELSIRVDALLRRPKQLVSTVLSIGDVSLDCSNHQVMKNGNPVHLTPVEFAVLEFLLRHPNEVFSNEALLERVWPADSERSPMTVRTCLKKLRAKIDNPGEESVIKNVHGVGYMIDTKSKT